MGRLLLVPSILLLVAAAPAAAAPPSVANEITASDAQQAINLSGGGKSAQAPERKICKQLDTTGTRLPRRACLTEREWKQLQEELQQ